MAETATIEKAVEKKRGRGRPRKTPKPDPPPSKPDPEKIKRALAAMKAQPY